VTAAPPAAPTPATPEQVSEEVKPLHSRLDALQTIQTALIVVVIILLLLVAYDIYINRKMLRQAAK
jgi:hypothetical protein